jgi:hypothetical protein
MNKLVRIIKLFEFNPLLLLFSEEISFSFNEGESIEFGLFFEQYVTWFTTQLEFEWPAG